MVPGLCARAAAIDSRSTAGSVGAGEAPVGVGVGLAVGDAVWLEVGEAETLGAAVAGAESDGAEPKGAGEGISVGSPAVEVEVAVEIGVVEGGLVGAGTGAEASDCGTGFDRTTQSEALLLVSSQLPDVPPGRRSRLDWAGGAGATAPSTNELLAVPQLTASITSPPTCRSASEPPSLASPPVYVASASGPYTPAELATRRCAPGASGTGDEKAALRVVVAPDAVT
jgi:hypothetical protein